MRIELILETVMLILFGLSWPINIVKSFRAKTTKGKSLIFLLFVWCGYIFGLSSKFVAGDITYVVGIYCTSICMVSIDIALFFRNARLDKMQK